MRPLWLRLIAAALALAVAFVAAVASFWTLVLGGPGLSLLCAGVAACSVLAVWPVMDGRWARGALLVLQATTVAVVLAGYAGLALLSAEAVRAGLMERAMDATPSDVLAFWTALAAGGVVATTIVVLALPVELGRRLRLVAVSVLAACGLLGAGAAVAIAAGGDPCDGFRFSRVAWDDEETRERVGGALVRCRTLQGMHRDDVDELLGGRFVNASQRSYTLHVSDDALGWPSYTTLVVTYGDDKRVRSASVDHWRD